MPLSTTSQCLSQELPSPRQRIYRTLALTALAPTIWGTTYLLFTLSLPVSHPLTMAALRSIPAGLLLLALEPRALRLGIFPQLLILGGLNIAAFSGLLFVAAAELPGGIAATLISTQPLFALFLAWPLLGERPPLAAILSSAVGVFAVWMLSEARGGELSSRGAIAALFAAGAMAAGIVLIKRFRQVLPPTSMAAWQLVLGGGVLLVLAPVFEGPPPELDVRNIASLSLLTTVGTALPFYLWTKGVRELGAQASFLGLLSPLVALALGVFVANEPISLPQFGATFLVLGASAWGTTSQKRNTK